MPLILGKSKALKPNGVREIKVKCNPEKSAIDLTKQIAKSFGQQSKKLKPKKFFIR